MESLYSGIAIRRVDLERAIYNCKVRCDATRRRTPSARVLRAGGADGWVGAKRRVRHPGDDLSVRHETLDRLGRAHRK